ncbi:MAG: DUF3365 domain-containing protein [Gammaproteobacteria bacterium]|jgi:hypothetical protein|nr:DUF3365 domain-containing protein [Gammaproteobacteria bacterium]MBT4606050.1 DUF3365 domain-containing protein [Thiotrichales bacterium]MBT3473941.1 DUF3365 domain-containing protein [Gammaproteobacteria bacterium]MBT3968198.1 DUF3365 domain-containing protein [Gammaproteobacteria bacterium]MBT4082044.1 DUF3365 domain-containing protein [Gammaproteobacteria bacterium]
MKKIVLGSIFAAAVFSPVTVVSAAADTSVNVEESRALTKALFKKLKGTLVTAMKEGGPAKAIAACNLQAQPITNSMSSKRTGMNIKRTSLRLRNEKNAPDAWEIRVLEQFAARASAGEDISHIEYHEVIDQQKGQQLFRYMKAIPAQKPCMVCHGELIAPDVLRSIRKLYPLEQAIGFQPGDLRGAFSVTRELN